MRNSTVISSNVVEEVRALKAQPGKTILIDGSSVLIHTLAEHDLIDEYRLIVYPVVLGGGKKVFPDGLRLNLHLVDARPLPSGVVLRRCHTNVYWDRCSRFTPHVGLVCAPFPAPGPACQARHEA